MKIGIYVCVPIRVGAEIDYLHDVSESYKDMYMLY